MNKHDLQNKLGNATERNVAKTLRSLGFWNHILMKRQEGQPCDIVGGKGDENGKITMCLIDAKHVEDKVSFSFDRIEPNQISSLGYARNFAKIQGKNAFVGFAIFFDRDKQLRWLSFDKYEELAKMGAKSVNMADLTLLTEAFQNDEDNNQ